VHFKKGLSRVLDARGDLICQISPFGRVFSADVSHSSGPSQCLLAGSSSSVWMWHRRLGHLSFDPLCCLSSLNLIQGLPKLKFKKDLVCHPCYHGKMIVASHSPVTKVMTSHPGELLHMDTVGQPGFALLEGSGMCLWLLTTSFATLGCSLWQRRMRLLLMLEI
jgi:hypothetical protein